MNENFTAHTATALLAASLFAATPDAHAAIIYASGQLLIENDPGTHDDVRENRMYRIDTATGIATALPIWSASTPAGLAGRTGGDLFGYRSGRLGAVDPASANAFANVGAAAGVTATGFDIMADGGAFIVSLSGARQLHAVDMVAGTASPIGPAGQIAAALDSHFGLAAGTSQPFIISLGSVGGSLYGINLETGRQNLLRIDPVTGAAQVIGAADAVDSNDGGRYSGYAALTGVDEDRDGQFDALFGNVNFWDHDGDSSTPDQRLGGVARFDLATGTWSLVGVNPGVIFFGFGSSPAPAPATALLAALGIAAMCRARVRRGSRSR